MTSKGDEGGADDFARFRVVAYRLADQDGWYLAETALSLEEFGSALLREGEALTALREIHTGFRRVAPGEKFRATGMFSFTTGAGPSTSGRIAGARRARTCSPRRRRVSGSRRCGWNWAGPIPAGSPSRSPPATRKSPSRRATSICPFPRILGWLEKLVEGEDGRIVADLEGSEAVFLFRNGRSCPCSRRRLAIGKPGAGRVSEGVSPSTSTDACSPAPFTPACAPTPKACSSTLPDGPPKDLARRGFAIAAADLATFSGPALRAKLYPAYLDHPATGATQSIVKGYKRVEGEVVDSPDPHRTPFHLFQDRIRIRRLGSFTARRLYRRTVA
jgi:hypothetical protein